MKLSFIGPGGAYEALWLRYALLRDNVLHHLEGGRPSDAFSALHQVAEALGKAPVKVPASKLAAEVRRARMLLMHRPVKELAISQRTRGELDHVSPLPPLVTRVVGAAIALPSLCRAPRTIGDLLEPLVSALCQLAEPRSPDDMVEIHAA